MSHRSLSSIFDNYIKRVCKLNLKYNVDPWKELIKVQALSMLDEELQEAIYDYACCMTGKMQWEHFEKKQKELLDQCGLSTDRFIK